MKVLLAIVGFTVVVPVIIAVNAMLNGWVLSMLWGWFMVPTLGLPVLSLAPAIGIALVISYLTHQTIDCESKKKELEEKVAYAALVILRPFFVLFFGWVVHLCM